MLREGKLDAKEIEVDVMESQNSNMPSFDIPGMPGASMGMLNLGDLLGSQLGAKTEKKKIEELSANILMAREQYPEKKIADLYDPEKMPENLRLAHEKNDETLERIYIGRRFNNDTERLEKLFELYTKMTSSTSSKNMESAS